MAVSELCHHFPLLCPSISPLPPTEFHGFINIAGVDHEVQLKAPQFPLVEGLRLHTDTHLHHLTTASHAQLLKAEKTSRTVLEFLLKFQQICSNTAQQEAEAGAETGTAEVEELNKPLVTCLLHHLEDLGWARVQQVAPDLTSFTLQTRDTQGRVHLLRVKAGPGYPQEEPLVEADLPEDFTFSYDPGEGMRGVVRVWEGRVAALQAFWDTMDELDGAALILDPPHPTRSHTTRRIVLGNNVNVQVDVSVSQPRSLPHCHLFGPSRLTSPLNARLTQKYQEWDPEQSIVGNLENILGETVVKERTSRGGMEEEVEVECLICYCLHFDDALPDQTCEHFLFQAFAKLKAPFGRFRPYYGYSYGHRAW